MSFNITGWLDVSWLVIVAGASFAYRLCHLQMNHVTFSFRNTDLPRLLLLLMLLLLLRVSATDIAIAIA